MTPQEDITEVQRRAEAIVTALLVRDRDIAADLILEEPTPMTLAIALATMVAQLHEWRVEDAGGDHEQVLSTWQSYLTLNRAAEETR